MKADAKLRLLVVDDEPDLVDSVCDLLRFDYTVFGATRAAEALQILEREPVHIVMSDQVMPEMTGVEFLSLLRERYPDTIRLLFTAYADIQAVINAINQGNVYRYITKPWEPQDLRAVLRQASDYYQLRAERKQLLAELQQKNAQLEAANAELRQANELKKAFIKVASHELRTPLTIVMGLAELAHLHPNVPEPLKGWVELIFLGSRRLNDRVDQLIKLLLAERYERPLNRTDVPAAPFLRAVADDVRTFIEQRRQRLDVRLPDDLGTIHIEPDKIRDAVLQLLMNAIKFTPDGGTIRLSARRAENGALVIDVTDTGLGIDADTLPRVFDPFFTRFDVSRHSSGTYEFDRRGLGLGLSVVKAFVEMHGGRVSAASKPGEGSTFTIVLPAGS